MEQLKARALRYGATAFGLSTAKGKRFFVVYEGKRINFGSKVGQAFIDHHDSKIQRAWKARHGAIRLKDGRLAYTVKASPAFWSFHLLW